MTLGRVDESGATQTADPATAGLLNHLRNGKGADAGAGQAAHTFVRVNLGNDTTLIHRVLGEQRQRPRGRGLRMGDALLDELGVVGHTCQKDTIPLEVHGAQFHLRFRKETLG